MSTAAEELSRGRALLVGVGDFSAPAVTDVEPDHDRVEGWERLAFAVGAIHELSEALSDLGYDMNDVRVLIDPAARVLRDAAEAIVTPTDRTTGAVLIHVLSHGFRGRNGTLYVAGADSTGRDAATALDVNALMNRIEDSLQAPRTLLLLDVCHAGALVETQWAGWGADLRPAARRAWVIAAAAPEGSAFAGRFSTAVAIVLRRLNAGRLPIDRASRHVPAGYLGQEIKRVLNRLCSEQNGYPQQLLVTPMEAGAQGDTSPLVNPRYVAEAAERYRLAGDRDLLQFLESVEESLPGLDPAHFVGRALGRDPLADPASPSFFTGRRRQLAELVAWLNDHRPATGLRVVVGRPGAGKSALLGVLVCAAQSALGSALAPFLAGLWSEPPVRQERMAAVHARGRTLAEVTSAVARQLGLPPPGAVGWTAQQLIMTLAAKAGPVPTIVVDALDEATAPLDLIELLLLPLARATRARQRDPACRLLVGTRRWPEFAELFAAAQEPDGGLCDLDAVPVDEFTADLTRYLEDRLAAPKSLPSSRRTARALAVTLARNESAGRLDAGAFLIAVLYANYLLSRPPDELLDPRSVAARAPRTLGEVLELNLAQMPVDSWRRSVLAALAAAKEPGIPARLVGAVAARFREEPSHSAFGERRFGPEEWRVEEILDQVTFYLRRSMGPDGVTHYRLFHQALVDHLRRHALHPPGGPDDRR